LLLAHQLPSKPAYFRVKVWRRLQALGAVAVKNSVYALPASEQTQEDFEWLLKEISEGGGEGLLCEARLIDGLSDEELRRLFNSAREADYDALASEIRSLAESLAGHDLTAQGDARVKLARLKANAAQIEALDFFGANGREAVEGLLRALENKLQESEAMEEPHDQGPAKIPEVALKGRTWVTRQRVHVDRIASAWLIQHFIDPEAQFKFVPAKGYAPERGELRFDMFEAEFTHDGDRCTFETLLVRMGFSDPALAAIGEIVHDIDLKDGKFGREETQGVARLIDGISIADISDEERIQRGTALFDSLYESFRSKRG
jgi:hypothetical protein